MKPFRRIFSFVPMCHRDNLYYNANFQNHFYGGLADEVDTVMPQDISWVWCERANYKPEEAIPTFQKLCEQIEAAHKESPLELIISHADALEFGENIEAIDRVASTAKKLGVPWVNFFCDSLHHFHNIKAVAERTTLNWCVETESLPDYEKLGRPTLCEPYVLNPKYLPILQPEPGTKATYDVSFVGIPTNTRTEIIGKLIKAGIPVDIAGIGWLEMGGTFEGKPPVPESQQEKLSRIAKGLFSNDLIDKINRRRYWPVIKPYVRKGRLGGDEYLDWIRNTRINLGLSDIRLPNGKLSRFLKLREIEFPGFGACLVTQGHYDIRRALQDGKEIMLFDTVPEAVDKIRYLQDKPERITEMGLAGRQAVIERHTWKTRLQQIADALDAANCR